MKIRFLGTGTSVGVPQIGCECPVCTSSDPRDRRRRTGIYVSTDETAFLVDTPVELREACIEYRISKVDAVVFTGEMGEEMCENLCAHPLYKGYPRACYIPEFGEAVVYAHRLTPRGGTLLLSPAATSFDNFSSYKARGEAFLEKLKTLR